MSKERAGTYSIRVNGKEAGKYALDDLEELDLIEKEEGNWHLVLDGRSINLRVESVDLQSKTVKIVSDHIPYTVKIEDALDELIHRLGFDEQEELKGGEIRAPMPGLVLQIMIKEGDTVESDQPLLILEAMKMENVIKSPGAGTVKKLDISPSEKVDKGKLMLVIE